MVIALVILKAIIWLFRMPTYAVQTEGKLYVFNKLSQTATVVDLSTGEEIADINLEAEVHEATLFNKGIIVASNYGTYNTPGNCIKVINTKTNQIQDDIFLENSFRPDDIVKLSDDKFGVILDDENSFVILDYTTGHVENKISLQQYGNHQIVAHPSAPFVYISNSKSGSISVIDLTKCMQIAIISCKEGIGSIDITPDGSEIWITNINNNTISIIDAVSHTMTKILPTGLKPLKAKFSIDGNYCLVANVDEGSVSVFDSRLKKEIANVSIPGKKSTLQKLLYHTPRPVNITMHPNGLYAFVSNSNADKIEVLDMKSFKLIGNIATGRVPDAMVFVD